MWRRYTLAVDTVIMFEYLIGTAQWTTILDQRTYEPSLLTGWSLIFAELLIFLVIVLLFHKNFSVLEKCFKGLNLWFWSLN